MQIHKHASKNTFLATSPDYYYRSTPIKLHFLKNQLFCRITWTTYFFIKFIFKLFNLSLQLNRYNPLYKLLQTRPSCLKFWREGDATCKLQHKYMHQPSFLQALEVSQYTQINRSPYRMFLLAHTRTFNLGTSNVSICVFQWPEHWTEEHEGGGGIGVLNKGERKHVEPEGVPFVGERKKREHVLVFYYTSTEPKE